MATNAEVSDCLDKVLVTYYQGSTEIGPDTLAVNTGSLYDTLKSSIDTVDVTLVNSREHDTYDSGSSTSSDNVITVFLDKRDGFSPQYGERRVSPTGIYILQPWSKVLNMGLIKKT